MKDKGEKGSFTVEAILSLSIFMFAFVTIVSLATIAKIESTTQYAIDQTAKEISRYTYIASRANLLVHPKDSAEATVDSIDEAVQSMYDFSDVLSSSTGGNGVPLNSEGLSDMLSGMSGDDFKSITASAQNVYNSFAPLMSDPKGCHHGAGTGGGAEGRLCSGEPGHCPAAVQGAPAQVHHPAG